MTGEQDQAALDALQERIEKARSDTTPKKSHRGEHGLSMAWRMVVELLCGIGIGFAIGRGLDALLGVTPLLMIVFSLLGFAAGVRTMMRTAEMLSRQNDGNTPPEGRADGI